MNNGTKVRTALRIAMSLYTAFMLWSSAVQDLGSDILTKVWIVLTIAAGWLVDYLTTYYNNDYTETAARHTAEMRQHKRELKEGYLGERFFTDEPEDEFDLEEEGEVDE